MLEGNDKYPTTLDEAFTILANRKVERMSSVISEGVAFTTVTSASNQAVAGDNGVIHNHIKCHTCQRIGHYSDHCPSTSNERSGSEGNISFALLQKLKSVVIPKWWILMDTGSTLDLISNVELLSRVWTVNHRVYIRCNAGCRWTNQQGYLPGYGVVWYDPQAIANILSLSNVRLRYRVKYVTKLAIGLWLH
jgi:hypothetical protein